LLKSYNFFFLNEPELLRLTSGAGVGTAVGEGEVLVVAKEPVSVLPLSFKTNGPVAPLALAVPVMVMVAGEGSLVALLSKLAVNET